MHGQAIGKGDYAKLHPERRHGAPHANPTVLFRLDASRMSEQVLRNAPYRFTSAL